MRNEFTSLLRDCLMQFQNEISQQPADQFAILGNTFSITGVAYRIILKCIFVRNFNAIL